MSDHLRKGNNVSWCQSAIAGSISGLVARTIIAPMDTIKIRYQLQPIYELKYEGILSTIKVILKDEGWKGLVKGNTPASIMYVLYGAIQFGSYSVFNNCINSINYEFSAQIQSLFVGALSGMVSSAATYPLDLLRTRFAANRALGWSKLNQTCTNILQEEGVKGFFRGVTLSFYSITLSTSLMFFTYESIKISCEETKKTHWIIDIIEKSAGFISGVVSKVLTFPIDTIRKRLQVAHSSSVIQFTTKPEIYLTYRNLSLFQVVKVMWELEGYRCFYKGLSIALMKTGPTTLVTLYTYEYCMRIFSGEQINILR